MTSLERAGQIRVDVMAESAPNGVQGYVKLDGLVEKIAAAIDAAVDAEREACAQVAGTFTTRPDARIHPDVPWAETNEDARHVAHTTAQQIAAEIRLRDEAAAPDECEHMWVDMRNRYIESGECCCLCGAIRATKAAAT